MSTLLSRVRLVSVVSVAMEERSEVRRLHAVSVSFTREVGAVLKENGRSLQDRFVRAGKRDQQMVETSPFTLSKITLVIVGGN